MIDLIANKSMYYATRRLQAGDAFTARSRADARALIAVGRARVASEELNPPVPAAAPILSDLASLRAEYQAKFGKRPFNGWDADALREKIAKG